MKDSCDMWLVSYKPLSDRPPVCRYFPSKSEAKEYYDFLKSLHITGSLWKFDGEWMEL